MFTRNRCRKTSKPSKFEELYADEEERWTLVEDESVLVSVDPAPYPKIGLNEEYERKSALGSRNSSADLKEFQPFLSNEERGTPKLAPPGTNLQRVPRRLSYGLGEVEAASSRSEGVTNGVVISPQLFGDDDDLKFGRTEAKTGPEDISEGCLFWERNQANRCKVSAQCGLEEDLFDDCSSQHRNAASGVERRRLNTWAPNASSSAERAARQVARTKSEVEFSNIFSETTPRCSPDAAPRLSSCSTAEDQVDSELAPPGYNARSRRESEPGRRVAEWTREECARNGEYSRLAKDSRQVVRELREDKEHFRDAQSEKSFVLLVDQLADVRVRNRFVRHHAGKRRMAVCEELERVTVGNAIGEYLLELRKQLNVSQVLNNMF